MAVAEAVAGGEALDEGEAVAEGVAEPVSFAGLGFIPIAAAILFLIATVKPNSSPEFASWGLLQTTKSRKPSAQVLWRRPSEPRRREEPCARATEYFFLFFLPEYFIRNVDNKITRSNTRNIFNSISHCKVVFAFSN